MMFRGTIHLLLYRLVYHELLIPADEVHDPASLAGYLVCNYLLYLRVSGQFHMACGMLHLFGFQLPETHHHYLLATGFTDYWRRINIYWKDFMVRIVFNPVVFRLKRRPQPLALAVATAAVFLTTWLLHAYQSYWLRGTWGFSVPDALFWGILGVAGAGQRPARRPPAARPGARAADRPRPRLGAPRAAKTAGTFATIALLWSLWSSPRPAPGSACCAGRRSVETLRPGRLLRHWFIVSFLMSHVTLIRDPSFLFGETSCVKAIGEAAKVSPTRTLQREHDPTRPAGPRDCRRGRRSWPGAWSSAASGPAARAGRGPFSARRCGRDEQSRADYERMERGYYEHLLDAGRRRSAPPRPRARLPRPRRPRRSGGCTSRRRRSRPGRWRSPSTTSASSCSSRPDVRP